MRSVRLNWMSMTNQTSGETEHYLIESVKKYRPRATVWVHATHSTWHTFDADGTGGENSECFGSDHEYNARACALAAVVRFDGERGRSVFLLPENAQKVAGTAKPSPGEE